MSRSKRQLQPLTVEQVVALAKRKGQLTVNPLRYRRERICTACFKAADLGLLRKERESCGKYRFYPIPETGGAK